MKRSFSENIEREMRNHGPKYRRAFRFEILVIVLIVLNWDLEIFDSLSLWWLAFPLGRMFLRAMLLIYIGFTGKDEDKSF
jgi:hypothetical protein